jgi:uncharacterized protein YjdB
MTEEFNMKKFLKMLSIIIVLSIFSEASIVLVNAFEVHTYTVVGDAYNNTTAVTSKGGYYSPDPSTPSKRYFFEMPDSWKTFNNATACAYWWEGTDNCKDNANTIPDKLEGEGSWQYSYMMKSANVTGKNIYYIDVPADVKTIIFHNGIDGGTAADEENGIKASENWGKNFQTINIGTECYDPGDNPNYPDGVESFDNMVFVVNLDDKTVSDYSGATTYGGEWMYLHADGTEDYTAGTVWTDIPADKIYAKGITLSQSSATLYIGETSVLTATVTPKGTANKAVTWTSSNTEVATVDKNGKVTAKAQGTATITATTTDGTALTASARITVKQRLITNIKLNKNSVDISVGGVYQLSVRVTPSDADDKSIIWISSNDKIATISDNGLVKGVSTGSAVITAFAGDGSYVFDTCTVNIIENKTTPIVYTVKYNANGGKGSINSQSKKENVDLVLSKKIPTRTGYKFLGWSTNKKAKTATYKSGGKYKLNSNATLYAVWKAKKTQKITGVKSQYIKLYGSKAFSLKAKASGKGKITYKSSNKKVATISAKGKITIKKAGYTNITVKSSETSSYKSVTKTIKLVVIPKDFKGKDIKSLKKVGSNSVLFKWNRDKSASGYLVQLSNNRNFISKKNVKCNSDKKSAKITNLKSGKVYHIRICSYITVSGVKYYSNWYSFYFTYKK